MFKKPKIEIEDSLNLNEHKLKVLNDPIFSSTIRLTIMMILNANLQVGFTILRKLLKLTPGNMDHHTKKLEKFEYLQKLTSISFKRPIIILKITKIGKNAFRTYANHLSKLLNSHK